ncbi:MAG TPA: ATP-binding protein [Terriglobales bacterium]|nr:ATP-binding protein [Terriglobales bacterium]
MVLLIVSVVGLVQTHQLRQELQRQETQQQTEQREQREWRMFFEHSPAAILTADGEGKIVMANPAAHKLLGFEDRPLTGEGIGPCLPALATALRLERASHVCHAITECRGWRPSGEMFLADIWFSLGDTQFGPRLGAVIVDAAERMQERERLGFRSAMATSQIAMGAVLHEIRNLCATTSLMHANLERVPSLHSNADFKALGNLIRALAKIAAAELRPGEGSLTSVDLRALLDQLRLIIDPWFRESEMSVDWELAEDLPAVWAEAPGLLQIFLNLVQNSHKAMSLSERKHLTISAGVTGDLVIVRIQDTGPGITAPAELFQPFHRSTGLKGLGLYVSRAIAHSFSGELRYEPTPVGSCFAVELLPLRTWQKVTVEHGCRTSHRQNSAC